MTAGISPRERVVQSTPLELGARSCRRILARVEGTTDVGAEAL